MYGHADAVRQSVRMAIHFFVNFRCISVKTCLINTKLGDFVNLGVLFLTMWINTVVANPIIYRLVPSPSRFENRQYPVLSCTIFHIFLHVHMYLFCSCEIIKSVKLINHWYVVFNVLDDSTTVHRENFSVDVQSIGVRGKNNDSVAVNIAVGEFSK